MHQPTIHPEAPVNERPVRALRLVRGNGVVRTQAIQHSPFRAIELTSIRHDRRDLTLLGHQKPLKLTHTNGRIDRKVRPVGGGEVDLIGDRVESPDAVTCRGMGAGEHLCQHTVGLGGRAVLARQR